MTIILNQIDHLVLTVRNIEQSIAFYCNVLGMTEITFGNNRKAVQFGNQKINLHPEPSEINPRAKHPTPGSIDICFITQSPINHIIGQLQKHEINIEFRHYLTFDIYNMLRKRPRLKPL